MTGFLKETAVSAKAIDSFLPPPHPSNSPFFFFLFDICVLKVRRQAAFAFNGIPELACSTGKCSDFGAEVCEALVDLRVKSAL